ncbi:hypothetical protein FOMPIDRAFT_1123534 [Fomitopsis schrenkii]|uniref:Cytochrome P450 n=1 Tax=Fomitopsis schrenkii TaxID=2126942 RepID=S8E5P3_FOMSC|nr:hypothetical protein FOMPIDRAFT_1123534 [Fomitopsis schrenkii]
MCRTALRLPPGPRRLFILGNIHQVAKDYQEVTFARWAKKYGDLMFAKLFTQPTLIINSQKIARDLLDKRGGIYSSRPRLVMMCEILDWKHNPATLPYDCERRRKQRRWIQNTFGDKATVGQFQSLQQREACILLSGLMGTPQDFVLHIKRYLASLILESVYGHRVTSLDDVYIMLMDSAMEGTAATGSAGGAMVDFFPLLKHIPTWMPGTDWKRQALHAKKLVWQARHQPYEMAREAVLSGNARPSFATSLIEEAIKDGRLAEESTDILNSAASLYGAGTDTAKTVLLTFILLMVLHPDVYRKCQEEVDRVIDGKRLPTFADSDGLPYVNCVIKEVCRYHPPVPLGIPHKLTQDDQYGGYDLPKDTGVIANLWSIAHNEEVYGDPDVFRPERFLTSELPDPDTSDPRNIIFGYGRRICPGRLFAEAAVFLAISNIIATLDINKARDSLGQAINPEVSFLSGFVSYPREFVCSIKPRSAEATQLVDDMMISISDLS